MAGKTQTVDQALKASAYPARCQRARTECQMNIMVQGQHYGSGANLERLQRLDQGSKTFLASATPTVGDLIHTQTRHSNMLPPMPSWLLNQQPYKLHRLIKELKRLYDKSMRQWRKEAFTGG
jgi:hypothetical protein